MVKGHIEKPDTKSFLRDSLCDDELVEFSESFFKHLEIGGETLNWDSITVHILSNGEGVVVTEESSLYHHWEISLDEFLGILSDLTEGDKKQ